jgi:hypothetical protein
MFGSDERRDSPMFDLDEYQRLDDGIDEVREARRRHLRKVVRSWREKPDDRPLQRPDKAWRDEYERLGAAEQEATEALYAYVRRTLYGIG